MSYISEDDRIDREQAYRRKLREAARPDQPATPNQESSTTMPTRNRWTTVYGPGARSDSRYGLQAADPHPDGAYRVVDLVDLTRSGAPRVVKTYRGETAWADATRKCEDLNISSRLASGGPR